MKDVSFHTKKLRYRPSWDSLKPPILGLPWCQYTARHSRKSVTDFSRALIMKLCRADTQRPEKVNPQAEQTDRHA